jgi:Leucine-rich repeat (LRR) protein
VKAVLVTMMLAAANAVLASAAEAPQSSVVQWIEGQGGQVVRDRDGSIVEISLARTWATDNDLARVAEIKSLKRLDLSFTYVTDRGIELLPQLKELEELTLDTAEFLTDAAMSHLRANRRLRKLVIRGVDITDVGLPYIAELTSLKTLDLSHSMLNDVGLESLPALTELEELDLGATRITGINLNFLKLLPKLRKLNLKGIQRRNGGVCWTPTIIDLDLETISMLAGLEELNLGVGISLGRVGKPAAAGEGNCRLTGGIQITDLGVSKLAKLKKLRYLELSGARLTAGGLKVLESLPLERLSLWNCTAVDDSAAPVFANMPRLTNLDLSYTSVSDATLKQLATLPRLKVLYLTDTKVTLEAAEAFRKDKPGVFVSWARRPEPSK